jgi:Cu/Ag efflux pump CusA
VITSTLFTLFVLPALYRLVLGVQPAPLARDH